MVIDYRFLHYVDIASNTFPKRISFCVENGFRSFLVNRAANNKSEINKIANEVFKKYGKEYTITFYDLDFFLESDHILDFDSIYTYVTPRLNWERHFEAKENQVFNN